MRKVRRSENFCYVLTGLIIGLAFLGWLVWPSVTTTNNVVTDVDAPVAHTEHINYTVVTGESVTSIAKQIIEVNHLDINPDAFASIICADNNIGINDFIHEGDVLHISFSVKEETGN